eukprot:14727011-Alexandrium_andersonii.AAC.1
MSLALRSCPSGALQASLKHSRALSRQGLSQALRGSQQLSGTLRGSAGLSCQRVSRSVPWLSGHTCWVVWAALRLAYPRVGLGSLGRAEADLKKVKADREEIG